MVTKNKLPNPLFWKNKKVLVTGHTGFKGSWLSIWLSTLGANIVGFSEKPPTTPSLFHEAKINTFVDSIIGDIRDKNLLESCIKKSNPDIIFHMAAQSLVRESYSRPLETYEVNVLGTLNLLEAVRKSETVKALINVTSDKCYKNIETLSGYKETDELGGKDPYSNSKACSELISQSYRDSFFSNDEFKAYIATARSGNVIGGGDWSEERLIPDIIRSITSKKLLMVRNSSAIRPWQHVLDPLNGYLTLIENLYKNGPTYIGAWNFGPLKSDEKSVGSILKYFSNYFDGLTYQDNNKELFHETKVLKLDSSKSREKLGWNTLLSIHDSLNLTCNWYKHYLENPSKIKNITLDQIDSFIKLAHE